MPPTIRTLPSGNSVAVWPERGSSIGDAARSEPEGEVVFAVVSTGPGCDWNRKPLAARRTIRPDDRSIGASGRNRRVSPKMYHKLDGRIVKALQWDCAASEYGLSESRDFNDGGLGGETLRFGIADHQPHEVGAGIQQKRKS